MIEFFHNIFSLLFIVAGAMLIGHAIDNIITDLQKFCRQRVTAKAAFERGRAGHRKSGQPDPILKKTPLKNKTVSPAGETSSLTNSQNLKEI